MEWTLEIVLVVLLLATLIQALRLERALGVLKRDKVALEALVAGFNASTRQAEAGVDRLKAAADGSGRRLDQQIAASTTLKDDLLFLSERGDRLADRLDVLVRAARPLSAEPGLGAAAAVAPAGMSTAEQSGTAPRAPPVPTAGVGADLASAQQRSEAERNLLQALRLAR